MRRRTAVALLGIAGLPAARAQAKRLTVFAAGSLRAALTEIAADFEAAPRGVPTTLVFGASGLLKDRLLAGEATDVFASANMEHPAALAEAGRAEPAIAFAGNALCALTAPSFDLRGQTLAARLLDPAVKVGTSTPGADPSGDYAFRMFERIEASGAAPAGSAAALKKKALQLTGGPSSPPPPKGRNVYGVLVAGGAADVFITYCTNAVAARREQPQLGLLAIPPEINVSAAYGLALLRPASPEARRFVEFLRGAAGRQSLQAHGFSLP